MPLIADMIVWRTNGLGHQTENRVLSSIFNCITNDVSCENNKNVRSTKRSFSFEAIANRHLPRFESFRCCLFGPADIRIIELRRKRVQAAVAAAATIERRNLFSGREYTSSKWYNRPCTYERSVTMLSLNQNALTLF